MMDHYSTVRVPITFHRPGESTSRMRCFLSEPNFTTGAMEIAPVADPHRWAVDEMEMQDMFGLSLFVKFRCTRCGETHHEHWVDEFPEGFEFLPRTVLNWDGSQPVGAWETSNQEDRPS